MLNVFSSSSVLWWQRWWQFSVKEIFFGWGWYPLSKIWGLLYDSFKVDHFFMVVIVMILLMTIRYWCWRWWHIYRLWVRVLCYMGTPVHPWKGRSLESSSSTFLFIVIIFAHQYHCPFLFITILFLNITSTIISVIKIKCTKRQISDIPSESCNEIWNGLI